MSFNFNRGVVCTYEVTDRTRLCHLQPRQCYVKYTAH